MVLLIISGYASRAYVSSSPSSSEVLHLILRVSILLKFLTPVPLQDQVLAPTVLR